MHGMTNEQKGAYVSLLLVGWDKTNPVGHFPTDDAATKLIWLALRNITADWGRAAKDWKAAMNQFAILYADRFVRPSV